MSPPDSPTAVYGLMQLLAAANDNPAEGTGIAVLIKQAHRLFGDQIPQSIIDYQQDLQINLFGSYPDKSDIAPSIVFAVVFGLFFIGHTFVFVMNMSKGHYFYVTLGWMFYCITRVLGFALRAQWAKDITKSDIGTLSEVFLVLSAIILVSFNLILAQRIFTWRHPVGGSRKLFWNTMFFLYALVAGIVAMTILASVYPLVHKLTEQTYTNYKICVKVSAILIDLYSLTSILLISLAYFFKPTRKDENTFTYQPWWIESFGVFYYVPKGSAKEAEESFITRHRFQRRPKRVIAATHHHHHYDTIQKSCATDGELTHSFSLVILCVSTLFIFIGAICRTVAVFQGRFNRDRGVVCKPIVMYICFGVFESIINILYLAGRADLRFYRPDRLPKQIRDIMTADHSRVSPVESKIGSAVMSEYAYSEADEERYAQGNSVATIVKIGGQEKTDSDSEFRF